MKILIPTPQNSNSFIAVIGMVLLCCLAPLYAHSQSGIKFARMSVEEGIAKAELDGKYLFVDTYAEWCIPCKRMKKVFADREVATYFNENYINIKINMDGPFGKTTYNDYDVIFLPTMMIFDHDGIIKYKTDKLLTAQELLNIGIRANVEGVYLGNNASQIVSTPFQSKSKPSKKKAIISAPKENVNITSSTTKDQKSDGLAEGHIVKVIGANDVMPPEVLYQEAYYQLQMMNDNHGAAALDYLKTQSDWGTHKNVKFIYDFVETTKSDLFEYIRNNRAHVASIIGDQKLTQSMDILVNQTIYQGYPRPSLDEAIELYNIVDPISAKQNAYQYYLGRMQQEGNIQNYLSTVNQYLISVAPNDHDALNKSVEVYTASMEYDKALWKDYKTKIDRAIEISPTEARYHVTLAKLFLMKKDAKNAKKSIEKAMDVMNENAGDLDGEINDVLLRISKS